MKRVNDIELNEVSGGFSGWALAGVSILITFVAGVIDGIARPKKCHNQEVKMKINDKELEKISGGGLGATFLNYLSNAIKVVYGIGQELGGSIRRIAKGKTCPL